MGAAIRSGCTEALQVIPAARMESVGGNDAIDC